MGMAAWIRPRDNDGRMGAIDTNDDGAADQVESVFAAMDGDDDGELTEDEYMSVGVGPGQGFNAARQKTMQDRKKAVSLKWTPTRAERSARRNSWPPIPTRTEGSHRGNFEPKEGDDPIAKGTVWLR